MKIPILSTDAREIEKALEDIRRITPEKEDFLRKYLGSESFTRLNADKKLKALNLLKEALQDKQKRGQMDEFGKNGQEACYTAGNQAEGKRE